MKHKSDIPAININTPDSRLPLDYKNYSPAPHWTQRFAFNVLIAFLIILLLSWLAKNDREHIDRMIQERDQHIQQLENRLQQQTKEARSHGIS